ncbi:guanine nucleotide-binding protein G(f) subunit alpha [Anthonomus grandis grandis]|uniref:guanine nucleotide-binding protein G(f) subunit alpha n=1 Tax=Anthonomus grandis grandis TaxID=2921223 RepID=UPI00216688A9|nr:guanine nucleotide-binding protein G(f) subunit alpha [Anthonomus grandis grandis]
MAGILCCKRDQNIIYEDEEDTRKYTQIFQDTKKILLLGTGESGKTTIIKQMKILHINGFSEEERKAKIQNIKQNVHESIYDIVDNMDKISPPVKPANAETKFSIDYILSLGREEPQEYSEEYYNHLVKLWTDEGVQETFRRSNEYQLIDSAEYFLNRIDEIRKPNYIPDTQDILFCRIETRSISKIEFEIPLSKFEGGKAKFWMYDVGGQRGHRKRWIRVFDGIQAILFLISASDFDQTLREESSKNRLLEAFDLLRDIHKCKFVRDAGLIVFLNKQDLLKRKIVDQGRRIEEYFPEYKEYIPNKKDGWDGIDQYTKAKLFMKHKVMEIASTPVAIESVGFVPGYNFHEELPPREVYVHFTVATDTNNIRTVFESVREIILRDITSKVFSL